MSIKGKISTAGFLNRGSVNLRVLWEAPWVPLPLQWLYNRPMDSLFPLQLPLIYYHLLISRWHHQRAGTINTSLWLIFFGYVTPNSPISMTTNPFQESLWIYILLLSQEARIVPGAWQVEALLLSRSQQRKETCGKWEGADSTQPWKVRGD